MQATIQKIWDTIKTQDLQIIGKEEREESKVNGLDQICRKAIE